FYYHFLDLHTGLRVWRSELSMIDTALLIAGALTASMYFDADTPDEIELRKLVDMLFRRIDWRWAQGGGETLRQGWKPECGFLHYGWEGYNEAIVLYVLALGSPSHPLEGACYRSWTATYQWENLYGYDFLYGGPLFVHQYSHAWIDFRGIRDRFMRETRCDYPEMRSGSRYASGFNPSLATADHRAWISPGHFGLDQGIVVMMIENHRSELIWRLMRDCPYIRAGLRRAGFRGGWL